MSFDSLFLEEKEGKNRSVYKIIVYYSAIPIVIIAMGNTPVLLVQ